MQVLTISLKNIKEKHVPFALAQEEEEGLLNKFKEMLKQVLETHKMRSNALTV